MKNNYSICDLKLLGSVDDYIEETESDEDSETMDVANKIIDDSKVGDVTQNISTIFDIEIARILRGIKTPVRLFREINDIKR